MVKCTIVRVRGNFSDVHSKGSLLICVSETEGKDVKLTYGDKGGWKENHVGFCMTDSYIQLEHNIDESGSGHPGGNQSIPLLSSTAAAVIFFIFVLSLKLTWLNTLMGRLMNDLYSKQ